MRSHTPTGHFGGKGNMPHARRGVRAGVTPAAGRRCARRPARGSSAPGRRSAAAAGTAPSAPGPPACGMHTADFAASAPPLRCAPLHHSPPRACTPFRDGQPDKPPSQSAPLPQLQACAPACGACPVTTPGSPNSGHAWRRGSARVALRALVAQPGQQLALRHLRAGAPSAFMKGAVLACKARDAPHSSMMRRQMQV